ncbi:MAG TPA: recombination protein O N-terminal domain-containing protein [Candidatus Paceibacterota bacterium]|nr:recombination protein O N-terminal domain-containing protein [Candidatus Paceibacterota bacterium]
MHHIHRTKAFVLRNISTKESDAQLILLTAEMGTIRAIVQGSRKTESKHRQTVQTYSLIDVALVSGRTGWRVVNANFIYNFFYEIKNFELRENICKTINLVDRLIAGELEDAKLFLLTKDFIDFAILNQEKITHKKILLFELIFTARILNILGYFDEQNFKKNIIEPISLELIELLQSEDEKYIKNLTIEINSSLRDSNL